MRVFPLFFISSTRSTDYAAICRYWSKRSAATGGLSRASCEMTKKTRFNIGYAIAAIFGILLIQYFFSMATQIATIPYSEFQKLLREGKVASVGVSDNFVQGTLKEPLSD